MPKKANTINTKEIALFDKLADQWWNPEGEFKLLHEINPIRITYIMSQIEKCMGIDISEPKPLLNLKMLDIGCGGGLITFPMHRLGAEILGIDASARNINVAQAFAKTHSLDVQFLCAPVETIKKAKKFDVILALEVIEHVENPESFVAHIANLLNPGGLFVVSTINKTTKSFLFAKLAAEYLLKWVPIGTHDWRKFLPPEEVADYAVSNGLKLFDTSGLKLSIPSFKWKISKDVSINYLASFKKCNSPFKA